MSRKTNKFTCENGRGVCNRRSSIKNVATNSFQRIIVIIIISVTTKRIET